MYQDTCNSKQHCTNLCTTLLCINVSNLPFTYKPQLTLLDERPVFIKTKKYEQINIRVKYSVQSF